MPELHRLGTPPVLEKLLSQLAKGLILITGPTGSGKSTTQAAMLEYLNRSRPVNIVTIEEPIEYAFTDKISGKAEYMFTSLGAKELFTFSPDWVNAGLNVSQIRAGVNYHF